MAGEKEMACCARGYHKYKDVEAAATREVLVCRRSLKRVLGTRLYICVLAGKDTNTTWAILAERFRRAGSLQ